MRLLFDENLSPRLVRLLVAEYPGSQHVSDAGLRGATDRELWVYAREHELAIVSKDTDFRERSFVDGPPPKVIWLEVGNAGTAHIADLLRREHARTLRFEAESDTSLLILSIGARAL
ncbi:MAG: DUF5615 family PIN-like protein [Chloroflexota bacterium]